MPEYLCKRCGYKANQKQNYKNHLNRKSPCKVTLNNISIDELKYELLSGNYSIESERIQIESNNSKLFKCFACGSKFTTASNRSKHIKNVCKLVKERTINTSYDSKLKELQDKYEKEIENLNSKIDILTKVIGESRGQLKQ